MLIQNMYSQKTSIAEEALNALGRKLYCQQYHIY